MLINNFVTISNVTLKEFLVEFDSIEAIKEHAYVYSDEFPYREGDGDRCIHDLVPDSYIERLFAQCRD